MTAEQNRTPSTDRGSIQTGMTEDKTPGFDPAVAPMETDAEAGGCRGAPAQSVRSGKPVFRNEAGFPNAMRRPEAELGLQPGNSWVVMIVALAVAVAAVAFILGALLR